MSTSRLVLVAIAAAVAALSQTQFEVASVRLNPSGGGPAYINPLPGRLILTNFALRRLILSAYGIEDYQLSREPSWINSTFYDIEAKADGDASVKLMEGPMLQTLLEDRFKLKIHRETVQLPVYELRTAKGGSKLHLSGPGSCTPYFVDSPPPPAPAPGAPRATFCGYPRFRADGPNRSLDGAGATIAQLAQRLSGMELNRVVTDKSGINGAFDIHLKWAVDAPRDPAAPGADEGPSIFTALQEQLGLKLESTKGPVEVLVIDHIEKPSAN